MSFFYEQQPVKVEDDENFAEWTIEPVHTHFLIMIVSFLKINPS